MFDMHGNAWQWCDDSYHDYPTPATIFSILTLQSATDVESKDVGSTQPVKDEVSRMLRGGAFDTLPQLVRSAIRYQSIPASRGNRFGFRPVRTLQNDSAHPVAE